MTSHVKWMDPPPIGGPQDPRSVWIERLRLIKEAPGQWAMVASGTPSAMYQTAAQLRQRNYHVPLGTWEFTVRTYRRGVHVGGQHMAQLFARFVSDEDDGKSRWDTRPRDEDGRLICPKCSQELIVTPGHTACPEHGFWLYKEA